MEYFLKIGLGLTGYFLCPGNKPDNRQTQSVSGWGWDRSLTENNHSGCGTASFGHDVAGQARVVS